MNAEDYRLAALGDADAQVRVEAFFRYVTCGNTFKIFSEPRVSIVDSLIRASSFSTHK